MKRCRLIYKSVLCPEKLPHAGVQEMAEKASLKNEKAGITGVLLLSGDHFLQVLEGPVKFVNQLYCKIVTDERHSNVELISYENVSTTFFHDWSMRLLRLDKDLPAKLRKTLVDKYAEKDGHISIPGDLFHVHALLLDARWGLLNSDQLD
jgi:hypothetical protein